MARARCATELWHNYLVISFVLFVLFPLHIQGAQFTCDPSSNPTHFEDCTGYGCGALDDTFFLFALQSYTKGTCTAAFDGPAGQLLSISLANMARYDNTNYAFYDGLNSSMPLLGRVYYTDPFPVNVLTTGSQLTIVLYYDGTDSPCETPCDFIPAFPIQAITPDTVPYTRCQPLTVVNLPMGASGVAPYILSEPAAPYSALTSYTAGNCSWRLVAPTGSTIQGIFNFANSMMAGDRVLVHDGGASSDPIIALTSGLSKGVASGSPDEMEVVRSSGNVILVEMIVRPGSKLGWMGFQLTLEATRCIGVNRVDINATSTSLEAVLQFGINTNYMPSPPTDCYFLLTAPVGFQFQLHVTGCSHYAEYGTFGTVFHDGNTTSAMAFPTSNFMNLASSTNQLLVHYNPLRNMSIASRGSYEGFSIAVAQYFAAVPAFTVITSTYGNQISFLNNIPCWNEDGERYFYGFGQWANFSYNIKAGVGQRVGISLTLYNTLVTGMIWITDSADGIRTPWYQDGVHLFNGAINYVSVGRNLTVEFIAPRNTACQPFQLNWGIVNDTVGAACQIYQDSFGSFQFPPPITHFVNNSYYTGGIYPSIPRNLTCTWTFNTTNNTMAMTVNGFYEINLGTVYPDTLSFFDGANTSSPLLFTQTGGLVSYCTGARLSPLTLTTQPFLTVQFRSSIVPSRLLSNVGNTSDVLSNRHISFSRIRVPRVPLTQCANQRNASSLPDAPYTGNPVNARHTSCAFESDAASVALPFGSYFQFKCLASDLRALGVQKLSVWVTNNTQSPPFLDETMIDAFCGLGGANIGSNGVILPSGYLYVNASFGPPSLPRAPLYTLQNAYIYPPGCAQRTYGIGLSSGEFTYAGRDTYGYVPSIAYSIGMICEYVVIVNPGGLFQFSFDYIDIGEGGWLAIHAGSDAGAPVMLNVTGRNFTPNDTLHENFGGTFFSFHAPTDPNSRIGLGYKINFNAYSGWCTGGFVNFGDGTENPYFAANDGGRVRPYQECDINLLTFGTWFYLELALDDDDSSFRIYSGLENTYMGNRSTLANPIIAQGPVTIHYIAGANPSDTPLTVFHQKSLVKPSAVAPPVCQGTQYYSLPTADELLQRDIMVMGPYDVHALTTAPYPAGIDCRWHFFVPAGYGLGYTPSGQVWREHDFVEVYIDGVLQRRISGQFALTYISVAGDVEIRLVASPNETSAVNRQGFQIVFGYLYLDTNPFSSGILGDLVRRHYGIPACSGVQNIDGTEILVADRESLYILGGNVYYLALNSGANVTFPNLISLIGDLLIWGLDNDSPSNEEVQPVTLQALAFPRLKWITELRIGDAFTAKASFDPVRPVATDDDDMLSNVGAAGMPDAVGSRRAVVRALDPPFGPISMELPQLVTMQRLVATSMTNVVNIVWPNLRFLNDALLDTCSALQELDFSTVHDISIHVLSMIDLQALTRVSYGHNVSQATVLLSNLPLLNKTFLLQLNQISNCFTYAFSPDKSIVFDGYPFGPACTVDINNNNYLTSLSFTGLPQDSFSFTLSIDSNYILSDLQMARFTMGSFKLVYSRVTSLALDQVTALGRLNLENNNYLATLYVPQLELISISFNFNKNAIVALHFPRLLFVESWTVQTGKELRIIDACQVTVNEYSNVGSFPKMSCNDYIAFVNRLGFSEDGLLPPDCDASTIGTYGCSYNETTTFNCAYSSEPYSLACIQTFIAYTVGGQGNSVLIPPGTYTGCSETGVLNTLGRAMVVYGYDNGSTPAVVIDCEGSGFAMTISNGEGSDTIIRNIEFRNGEADTGGAVLISGGASPTFDHVTFSANTASSAGGAVAVTGVGAAPMFLDCVFDANWVLGNGAGGGALFVDEGSTASIHGGRFLQNSAPFGDGGAILFLGAASAFNATVISDAVFVENEAVRGGGIFSEGALMLHHVTLTGNTASKLGGGLAAVPTSDLGIWFDLHASNVTHNVAGTGGGIFIYSANLAVSDALIEANTASGTIGGGGLATVCSQNYRILFDVADPCPLVVSMTRSTLLGNVALNGGGGGVMIMEMVLWIDDVLFNKNTAGSGGGMSLTTSSVYASLLTFMANSASLGAGVYCEPQRGVCSVSNSSFVGNRASTAGAGAYLCVAACPYAANALDRFGPVPDPRAHGNTFALNVAITGRSSGYGSDVATDASSLVFSTTLPTSVLAGRFIGGYALDGETPLSAVVVQINDYFGQLVSSTTDNSVLTVSLSVESVDASLDDVSTASVGGTQTALAISGGASFVDSTIIVSSLAGLNQRYMLIASLAEISGVTVATNLTVVGCDVGQGRAAATDSVTCLDCGAGSYASDSTEYVCTPCAAGSYATGRVSSCTPCASGTFAPLSGAATCQMCPDGYGSEVGAASCDAKLVAAGLSSGAVGGVVSGVIIAVVGAILVLAFFLYRAARRRTMQKYYLDNDATIRTGTQESPLQKEVKRLLLAASTTRIGGGLYSNVYKAKYENAWIALKVIKGEMATNGTPQQEFRREAIALSRLEERNHPGIVKLCFFLSYNPMCIGVGFCSGGSLKQALANGIFPLFRDKVRLAAEAASAFCAIHTTNIVHLDIKTDNILLSDENHVIIADFGIARVISESTEPALPSEYVGGSTRKLGSMDTGFTSVTSDGSVKIITETEAYDTAFTPQYVDPIRIIQDMNHDGPYLKRADMFSFAITMWAIASGSEPYAGEDPNALVERLRDYPQTRPPAIPGIAPAYATWMERCWHAVPTQRPTFPELLEGLKAMLAEYALTLEPGYA